MHDGTAHLSKITKQSPKIAQIFKNVQFLLFFIRTIWFKKEFSPTFVHIQQIKLYKMKKIFFTLMCAVLFSIPAFAQDINAKGDNIIGEYLYVKKSGDSKIRISKVADGTYTAQVFWVANDLDENGNKRKDVKNKNKSLRNVDLDKVVIIKGLKYNADDKEWGDTDIYDPSSGKTYSVDIEFKDAKTLKVYGNIWGIGKTVYWQKIK